MSIDLKKNLLAGVSVIAVTAFAMMTFIADANAQQFRVDVDNNDVFENPAEDANSGLIWGTNVDGQSTASKDLQVLGTGTINIQNTTTIGNGDADAAITASGPGSTLTINDNEDDDATTILTIDGAITAADLSLVINGSNGAGNPTDIFGVSITNDVNLGTGTFTANSISASSPVYLLMGQSNFTAASIVLNEGASDVFMLINGGATQTYNGTIDGGNNGEGLILISNTSGAGAIFNDAIGSTTAVEVIALANNGVNVRSTFRDDVTTVSGLLLGFGDAGGSADTYTVVFDTAGNDIDVGGVVEGVATDLANITIQGGNTVTNNSVWGGATANSILESIVVNGSEFNVVNNVNSGGISLTGANSTLTVSGTSSVTGNITGDGSANTFNLSNTAAMAGAFNLGGGADVVNLNGGSIAGILEFGSGNNVLNVGGVFTTAAAFQATAGNIAMNVLSGGDFTLAHALNAGAGNVTTSSGGSLALNQNLTTTGMFTNNGTAEIALNRTLTAATYDATSTGSVVFVVNRTAGVLTNSSISLTGGALDLTNTTVDINLAGGSDDLVVGDSFTIGQGTAPATINTRRLTGNSSLYDYLVTSSGNNILFSVVANQVIANENDSELAELLSSGLAGTTDPQLIAIQNAFNNASSEEETSNVLRSVQTTVDDGARAGASNVLSSILDIATDRLASLSDNDLGSGLSSGDEVRGLRAWGQAFGLKADQGERQGIAGYDASSWGGVIGLDTEDLVKSAVIGAALSYGSTDVNSNNVNSTDTDIDSYQLTLYGDYDFNPQTYVSGLAAYAYNDIDTLRHNVGTISGLDAKGDYKADQYTIRAEAGHRFKAGGFILTPNVMTHWTHFNPEDYTETGAGGASLNVSNEETDIFEVGVGLKAGFITKLSNGAFLSPQLRVGYRYDLVGDNVQATTSFTGGGTAFSTEGFDPARSTYNLGLSVKYYAVGDWEMSADYGLDYKSDYVSHAGFLRAAYKF